MKSSKCCIEILSVYLFLITGGCGGLATTTVFYPPYPGYALESQTGVTPEIGNYSFSIPESSFSVSGWTGTAKVVIFSPQNYTGYAMLVNNGEFHFQNGYVGNNNYSDCRNQYPTDGFRITGHFNTPTDASGTVEYVYDGVVFKTETFTATLYLTVE